jgi:hypothetical protein
MRREEEARLWSKEQEIDFFTKSLGVASPEELFYRTKDKKYFAYWPKSYKGKKTTLQSRNAYIGGYTEKWSRGILTDIAKELKAYAITKVVCEELSLTRASAADVAICKTDSIVQKPEDIIAIFEVKMSVVWNWELTKVKPPALKLVGDYKTHKGTPGLLRSDSMLKAIGKGINIRLSSKHAARIPIIILGNTPIHESYYKKVDTLKNYGIIQGFWSLNPTPLDGGKETVKTTKAKGFLRFDRYADFRSELLGLLKTDLQFFAGMRSKDELGRLIEIADEETTYEQKATKLLELIG